MYDSLKFRKVAYSREAAGWVDKVYYPRVPEYEELGQPAGEQGAVRLHSRVWQEIEETGFGMYYYEETTELTAELEGADYKVTAVLVNPSSEPYTCHVRLNNVVKLDGVTVEPGEEKEIVFTACMTDGSFALRFAVGAMPEIKGAVLEGDVYLKDIEIVQEPLKKKRERPYIFLVSDSTVQSYEKRFYPQTGWGQVFYRFFRGAEQYSVHTAENCSYSLAKTYELPEVVIENRAIGGRSARSFYDEGKLDQVLEVICPGDYMFLQFAHNDDNAARPNRYIAPEEYPAFLQRYVDACRRRGVQCVLVTAVTMRDMDENGKFRISFNNYRLKMIELAEREGLPLLDLGARSTAYLDEIGPEESKNIYLWVAEGEYPDGAYAAGVSDRAHLQESGAEVYADMVAQMIAEYRKDDSLDTLKKLVEPKPFREIKKPEKAGEKTAARAGDTVTGFVVQEISIDNGRGSFLLNWNETEGAVSYAVYGKKKEELTFEVVKTVTRQEKDASATLPFSAEAGYLWQYYVVAVFANGSEGHASRMVEVDLRGV